MFRGTTPTVRYKIKPGIDLNEVEALYFTFKSISHEMTKEIDEVEIDPDERYISYTFTQEETLAFNAGPVDIQLRIRLNNGSTMVTKVARRSFNAILDDRVL